MKLKRITFEEETRLRYEFHIEMTGRNRFLYTLIAKFIGEYRPGSQGAPDAHFIRGITQTALEIWNPGALILDLRELSYVWGDEMDLVLDTGTNQGVPLAIVGSELCLPAIGTLVHGINSKQPATDLDHIFENIEEAWQYIRKKT